MCFRNFSSDPGVSGQILYLSSPHPRSYYPTSRKQPGPTFCAVLQVCTPGAPLWIFQLHVALGTYIYRLSTIGKCHQNPTYRVIECLVQSLTCLLWCLPEYWVYYSVYYLGGCSVPPKLVPHMFCPLWILLLATAHLSSTLSITLVLKYHVKLFRVGVANPQLPSFGFVDLP